MKKYDISILAILKNEESFLPEWIEHYLNRNIDHLYLLNDLSDDSSVDIIMSHQSYGTHITLKHVDIEDSKNKEVGRQVNLYNKYYSYCLSQTSWIGVFDLDEFCYSPQELDFKKILFQYNNNDIHELVIDWYWFGSNGYTEQPKSIVKSFNKRSSMLAKDLNIGHLGYGYDWCCKSFAKTIGVSTIKHHYNIYQYNGIKYPYGGHTKRIPFSYNMSNDGTMFINHYIGARKYFFDNKVKRGSCNNNQTIQKNKQFLYDFINFNEVEDNRLINQNQT